MNCKKCREMLYPEDPEAPFYDPHRKRYLPPLCQGCPNAYQQKFEDLGDRVDNLEAILAEPGQIPKVFPKVCDLSKAPVKRRKAEGVIL